MYDSPTDANGNLLRVGDLVWLNVYEVKLRQNGATKMLGRICNTDLSYFNPKIFVCSIDIGGGLPIRQRESSKVEFAPYHEKEFQKQIDGYAEKLMLTMLESEEGKI